MRQMRLGMAQVNMTVGDFEGNLNRILTTIDEARSVRTDLVIFPELAVCGYPPEDLLFKPRFLERNLECIDVIVRNSQGIALVVGFADRGDDIYNAAAVIHDGKLIDVYHKIYLPNYGVFDEDRYFKAGQRCPIYMIAGAKIGVTICEDMWYESGPGTVQARHGAEILVNISASPYHFRKSSFRQRMLATRAADNVAVVAHTNLVGGQDELVFDGSSMLLDEKGRLAARAGSFQEELLIADVDVEAVFRTRLHDPRRRKELPPAGEKTWSVPEITVSGSPDPVPKPCSPTRIHEDQDRTAEIYSALVLGTHDYIVKNGIKEVIIGLSGGIDSSLVAVIAVDALGPSAVVGLSMPSRYTSSASITDAEAIAHNLGIRLLTIPIEGVFRAYLDTLAQCFKGAAPDVTEENIQARIRGNLLMALSNKFGYLVLTTGNKSEMATGYTTLYGDMAGGFAVIKDVPKTMVYELASYRNSIAGSELIPSGILEKAPSAELRAEQKDIDSLPPYDVLDTVLTAYVEEDRSVEQIISGGIDEQVVRRAVRLVDTSEYKRRQAPPGVKITARAFGRDRRLPITNRFRG